MSTLFSSFCLKVTPRLALGSVLFCVYFQGVFADEASQPVEAMTIYGQATTADQVDVSAQPSYVSVIEVKDLPLALSSVSEVLATQAGVQVRDMGGMGAFSTVSLRGASSQQVNVYLDGVLLNDLATGTVDLGRISLHQVDSIEIYRGAPPVQFGQSAIGGAILIKSRAPMTASSGEVAVGYGSFNTSKASASGAWRASPAWTLNGSLGYQASDNDFRFLYDNLTPLNSRDDTWQHRENNEVDMLNGLLGAHYQFSDNQSLKFSGQHHRKHQSIPDLFNSRLTDSALDSTLSQTQVQFSDRSWWQGGYSLQAFWGRETQQYYDRQGRIGLGVQDEVSQSDTSGILFNSYQSLSEHHLAAHGEWKQDRFHHEQRLTVGPNQRFRRQSFSAGVQDDWSMLNNRLLWQNGLRVQAVMDQGQQPNSVGYQEVEEDATYLTGQTGLKYELQPEWVFKSNFNRGVRIPRLAEKFGDRGLFVGNEDLVEETALNLDAGMDYQPAWGTLTAFVFQRWLEDAIVATYDSRGVGKYLNISEAEIRGAEWEARWQICQWLGIQGRSTLQHTENTSGISDQRGKPLAGHYEQSHYLAVNVEQGAFSALLEYQREQGGFYDSAASTAIPDKNLIHLGAKWTFLDTSASLEMSARNLLAEHHEAFNGYPGPGRQVFLAWRQTFQ